jgi:hypothetical protein
MHLSPAALDAAIRLLDSASERSEAIRLRAARCGGTTFA